MSIRRFVLKTILSPNSFDWLLNNNSEFTGKRPKQNRIISKLQKYINPTGYRTCRFRYGSYVASYTQPLQCANLLYVYWNVGKGTQPRQLGARSSGWNILISKLEGKSTAKLTSSNRITTSKILIIKMEYTFEADTSWFWMTVSHEDILGKLNRCETKWSEPFMILKQHITMGKIHFQSEIKMACFYWSIGKWKGGYYEINWRILTFWNLSRKKKKTECRALILGYR